MAKEKTTKKNKPLKNLKWETFCRYFVLNEETYNNRTWSYALAFNHKLDTADKTNAQYEDIWDEGHTRIIDRKKIKGSSFELLESLCSTAGSLLLRKYEIQGRITELYNSLMTNEFVDRELVKVIKQDHELHPKLGAIREFNLLNGRIVNKNALTDSSGRDVIPNEKEVDRSNAAVANLLKKHGYTKNSKKRNA